MEIPKIKSPDDLKKILEETGSNLSGVIFSEGTLRIGTNDVLGVEKEKPDGETSFYPYLEDNSS